MRAVHENFEALVSQTESHLADSFVHESTEALGEVTTTSASYVELSGGPEITVRTRPGLMIAVLLDCEAKNSGGSTSVFSAVVDGGSDDLGAGTSANTSYVRVLSSGSDIDPLPNGKLAVFPATATSSGVMSSEPTMFSLAIWSWTYSRPMKPTTITAMPSTIRTAAAR